MADPGEAGQVGEAVPDAPEVLTVARHTPDEETGASKVDFVDQLEPPGLKLGCSADEEAAAAGDAA